MEDTAHTYREGVKEAGSPISHEDANRGAELRPSTLWRWAGRLGRFPVTVRQALNLIKQKDPSTDVFRVLGGQRIRPGKFRGEARKHVLERCRALVTVNQVYARVFSASVFPELATRCGFG